MIIFNLSIALESMEKTSQELVLKSLQAVQTALAGSGVYSSVSINYADDEVATEE